MEDSKSKLKKDSLWEDIMSWVGDDVVYFGCSLRVQRESLGLRVAWVAERLGYHVSYIYYLENLRMPTRAAYRYRDFLDEEERKQTLVRMSKHRDVVLEFLKKLLDRPDDETPVAA